MMHHHSTSTRTLVALIFFCIGHNNLPLIYAQSGQNCVALPCTYKNECRDKFNTCGGGQLYCNSESLWLPACGGGGSFERPSENNDNADSNAQVESTTPPPTPRPTLRSTSTPTKRPTNSPTLSPQQSSIETSPTTPRADTPTTTSTAAAFEGWPSEQKGPKNEIDEETENFNPSNVGWFDEVEWDGRREKGENNETNEAHIMRRTSCGMLGIATLFHLFMILG